MIKTGVDIVKISRFESNTDSIAIRVLSSKELQIYNNFKEVRSKGFLLKVRYLAKRFCAKEALYKAGNGQIKGLETFSDISILNREDGSLYVLLKDKELKDVSISISDEDDTSVSFCVVNI